MAGNADEHPGIRSGKPLRHQGGVLQRFPGKLEQQALLRIDMNRLARRHSEEVGVEVIDLAEQPGAARVDLALLRIGMMIAEVPTLTPSRTTTFDALSVRSIRHKLRQSQSEFAFMIGVSPSTLRNWEQGLREPEGPARALLTVAQKNPTAVYQALHG